MDCSIYPQVRNVETNEIEDSRLYKDLLSFTNVKDSQARRKIVNEIYSRVTGESFLDEYRQKYALNSQNEPDLGKVLQSFSLDEYLDMYVVKNTLNDYTSKKSYEDTYEGYVKALADAMEFNSGSMAGAFAANVYWDNDGPHVAVSNNSGDINAIVGEQQKVLNLNKKMAEQFSKAGIDVQPWVQLEHEMSEKGDVSLSGAITSADGVSTIVKIAKDKPVTKVVSEELAHYVCRCLKNEALYQRLHNLVKDPDAVKAILGDSYSSYVQMYGDDTDKLSEEAIVHLVQNGILNNADLYEGSLDTLLTRLKNVFKTKFSKMSDAEIDAIVEEAKSIVTNISRDALERQAWMRSRVFANNELLYSIDDKASKIKKLLKEIIDREVFRSAMYERGLDKDKAAEITRQELNFIALMKRDLKYLDSTQQAWGIVKFVENANKTFKLLNQRLKDINEGKYDGLNDACRQLSHVQNYLNSYKDLLAEIAIVVNEDYNDTDQVFMIDSNDEKVHLKSLVDETISLSISLQNMTDEAIKPFFVQFMSKYLGEDLIIPFGSRKGERIRAEDLVSEDFLHKDVTFLDRWLNSMANSHDTANKVFDTAVKQAKTTARLRTDEFKKRLEALATKLEKAGIKDLSFVYERDSLGRLTLNFVSKINYGEYRQAKQAAFDQYKESIGGDQSLWSDKDWDKYNRLVRNWMKANTVYNKSKLMYEPNDKYHNSAYDEIMKDPLKAEFYKFVTESKIQMDAALPVQAAVKHTVPVVMRDTLERIKSVQSLGELYGVLAESMKDEIIRRSDDIEYGDASDDSNILERGQGFIMKHVDFQQKPIDKLPLYYQKLRGDVYDKDGKLIQRGDDVNDVSTDIVSAMTAYAYMAYNYQEMDGIIDTLEMSRNFLDKKQRFEVKSGPNNVIDYVNYYGNKAMRKVSKNTTPYAKQQRDDFFAAQVYGRYFKDAGTIKLLGQTVDLNKLANLSNKLTSINGLAFNVLAGMANLEQGIIQMDIEATAKQFFSTKDVWAADAKYAELLPEFMLEVGSRIQKSKLALFDTLFNVLQEYDKTIRDTKFDRRTWLSKMFGSNFLFVVNNAGEHWMQNRTFFALVMSEKEALTDKDGNKVKIFDAFDRKFIQDDGSLGDTDRGLGAKLVLKSGMKYKDGRTIVQGKAKDSTEMSLDEFINKISRKSAEINHRMHGIYNNEDMSAFQRLAVGRMAMIFRKWIVPSFVRRFDTLNYNMDLEDWTEGYYTTVVNTLGKLYTDIKSGQFTWQAFQDELSDTQKANLKKAGKEMLFFTLICLALAIIPFDDLDDERPWISKIVEYQLYRMRNEIGTLTPNPIMFQEILRTLQSPSANINTWEDLGDMANIFNPANWLHDDEHIVHSGPYKGHTKGYKALHKSPIFPFENDIMGIIDPIQKITFFKN